MKILHFVEATGTDEVAFPVGNVTLINIQNDQAIRIWFSNSDGQTNDHRVDITTANPNTAEECADYFSELINVPSGVTAHDQVYTFTEGSTLPSGTIGDGGCVINTIVYNVGA